MGRVFVTFAAVVVVSSAVVGAQAKTAADGKKVYDSKKCAECHSIAGKGKKIAPLDGVATKLSPDEIRKWLTDTKEMEATLKKKPQVKMSSKKVPLTPPEIDALVAYITTLK